MGDVSKNKQYQKVGKFLPTKRKTTSTMKKVKGWPQTYIRIRKKR